jgi:energy-coupling factor transporter ATP-binding protein EcfA2
LPQRFSRGLRQKAAIAIAFIRPFELLLVDEPFVGLDAAGKEALLALFDQAAADGATLVVATHELSFVNRVQRIVALRDGHLIHDGPPANTDIDALVRTDAVG